jgi:hypothetical protein
MFTLTQLQRDRIARRIPWVYWNIKRDKWYDTKHYGCVVGEVIHRPVDLRYASERHLGAHLRGTWYGETHAHFPYGEPLRLIKEDKPFKRDVGMLYINPFAESADAYCARLRTERRLSRVQRGADPETGLMSHVHATILRHIAKLRVLMEHPNTPENERAAAQLAINRLVEKAERLDRKLRS